MHFAFYILHSGRRPVNNNLALCGVKGGGVVKSFFSGEGRRTAVFLTGEKVGKMSKAPASCYVDRWAFPQNQLLWKRPVEKPVECVEKFGFPQATSVESQKQLTSGGPENSTDLWKGGLAKVCYVTKATSDFVQQNPAKSFTLRRNHPPEPVVALPAPRKICEKPTNPSCV